MLAYIGLGVVQFFLAFLGAPFVLGFIPISGDPRTFAHAAVFAVIVWLVGLITSLVLTSVRRPGLSTLASALVLALAGAAVLIFAPSLLHASPIKFPPLYVPLFGAILGYLVRP